MSLHLWKKGENICLCFMLAAAYLLLPFKIPKIHISDLVSRLLKLLTSATFSLYGAPVWLLECFYSYPVIQEISLVYPFSFFFTLLVPGETQDSAVTLALTLGVYQLNPFLFLSIAGSCLVHSCTLTHSQTMLTCSIIAISVSWSISCHGLSMNSLHSEPYLSQTLWRAATFWRWIPGGLVGSCYRIWTAKGSSHYCCFLTPLAPNAFYRAKHKRELSALQSKGWTVVKAGKCDLLILFFL